MRETGLKFETHDRIMDILEREYDGASCLLFSGIVD